MASPFPGMDPFIEAEYFPTLHDSMIFLVQESLQPRLPADYFAMSKRRVWIDTETWIEPDVAIRRSGKGAGKMPAATMAAAKPVVVAVPLDETVEPYLNIYKKKGDKRRLVCSLEILSPTNKSPGEKGRTLYRRKQRLLLERKVHLVEIDLLRGGQHTTAVALNWAIAKAGEFDYHVCVRRFNRFEEFEVYPILLPQPLPVIAVPLMPADGDIELDLQAVFQRAYDAGPYQRAVDYRTDKIEPPLTKERSEWMRGILKKAGIERKRARAS